MGSEVWTTDRGHRSAPKHVKGPLELSREILLKQTPRPLVGVGAAHLVGPDGLAALLEQRGYTVRRLQ